MIARVVFFLGIICLVASECTSKRQFCFPKYWQSGLSFSNVSSDGQGKVQINPEYGHIYVDHLDQKLRVDIFTTSGKETLLVLFKQNVGYAIMGKICHKFTPFHEIKWCTPVHANISRPYRLGHKSSISVVDYGFHFLSTNAVFSATIDAPISFRLFPTLSGEFSVVSTALFENYLPTKPDPRVFVVPKICKHEIEGDGNVWETLDRRPLWKLMSE